MAAAPHSCPTCATALPEHAHFCHVCGAPTPAEDAPSVATPELSETGRRLARALGTEYELRRLLGAGGFAEVYLAWDRRLRREVAVKVLRTELSANPGILQRFRREAEAIAQLRHPHVVPIFSVAESDATAYFVMPLVRGVSLAEAMAQEERWSFAEVCRILREAAGALAVAHAQGIVHRDIKPANIMLEGAERRVVLMDFGIAKSMDQAASTALTGTGIMVGTPHYMSPEQAAGDPEVNHLSDQYSLGLVGYRLLTGQLPFEAGSARALMMMHASQPPRPVQELRPDAPAALARVIERALEKDPARRFPGMSAVSDALDRVARDVAGEFRRGRRVVPLADRWVQALEATRRAWRPAMWIAAAAVGTLVVAGPSAMSRGSHAVLAERDEALFAARAALVERGLPEASLWSRSLSSSNAVYRFLYRAVGRDSADALGRGPFAVWRWEFDFVREASGTSSWNVGVSAGPRVVRTVNFTPAVDSSSSVPADTALAIARAELQRARVDVSRLTPVAVDSSRIQERSSYTFGWRDSGTEVVHENDTAAVLHRVRVTGREVRLRSQAAWLSDDSGTEPGLGRGIATPIVLTLLGLGALFAVVRRSASDVLQWTMAVRLGLVVAAAMALSVSLGRLAFRGESFAMRLLSVAAGDVQIWLSFAVLTALLVVTAESLTYDDRPEATAGVAELLQGHARSPECMPAALTGTAGGLVLLALVAAILAVLHAFFRVPLPAQPVFQLALLNPVPWLGIFAAIAAAVPMAAGSLLLAGLLGRRRWGMLLAAILAALVFGGAMYLALPPAEVIVFAIAVSALPMFTARFGLLAGIIAGTWLFGIPIAMDMVGAGGPYLTSGLVSVGLLLAPVAWAVALFFGRRGLTA